MDVTVVLDARAILALLQNESAAARVGEAMASGSVAASAINLGEVHYRQIRVVGASRADAVTADLRRTLTVVDPDWELVLAASAVKARGGLSFADAFCIATAARLGAPAWTGDREIVAAADRAGVEVVDLRA